MPSGAVPTPIALDGKRGGILQLSIRSAYATSFDTFSAGGLSSMSAHAPLLNNLVWPDPYATTRTLVGDTAERWEFSGNGTLITFKLRKGITFHDGHAFTSKDVAYNIDRAWHPRAPTMNQHAGQLNALAKIETPDDFTVRLTMTRPSNFFFSAMTVTTFLMYPAHMPMPEFNDQWNQTGIGTGPFKMVSKSAERGIEMARNPSYFKPGLPYLDGVRMNSINDPSLVLASFRTGRLDATNIDSGGLTQQIVDGTLAREQGFVRVDSISGGTGLFIANKPPFSDVRVREALHLAMNRKEITDVAYQGLGVYQASPLISPELGGVWGIPASELKTQPGFRDDKTEDLKTARALLAQAGVDPSKVRLRILVSAAQQAQSSLGTVVDSSVRPLGFKDEIVVAEPAERQKLRNDNEFEISVEPVSPSVDDPLDYLARWVATDGAENGKRWSNPTVDRLLADQDVELDQAKRKQLINQIQDNLLKERYFMVLVWRIFPVGYNGYVKNYPPKLPLLFDPRFREEQVWIDNSLRKRS